MNDTLIKSLAQSNCARQEYNDSVLVALRYSKEVNEDTRKMIDRQIEALKFKRTRNKTAENIVLFFIIVSVVSMCIGVGHVVWTFGL